MFVQSGKSTPLQKVLKGKKTVEGFLSGKGSFKITRTDGKVESYSFPSNSVQNIEVNTGDIMQWTASARSNLVFYEICYPPFEEGRFQNLDN